MSAPDWKLELKKMGITRARRSAAARASASPVAGAPSHRAIGDDGEELAVQYLTERGVIVLARNVRYENGELDLVARHDAELLFVEIRLRQDDSRGTALESVTPRKRARILRAARRWLSENGGTRGLAVRFDVVGIQRMPFQIDWVCGAFDASPY